jgi:hypothetical protein
MSFRAGGDADRGLRAEADGASRLSGARGTAGRSHSAGRG